MGEKNDFLESEEMGENGAPQSKFMAMISHEMKTPLAILHGYLKLLEMQIPADNEWSIFVHKALEQEKHLIGIITNMVDLSKVDACKLEFNFTHFNIKELIDECIDNMLLVQMEHPIERHCQLEGVVIFADRIKISQVIFNLLTNAIKYTHEKGKIVVSGYIEGDDLIIQVTDFGPGIPAKDKEKIFDIFYRVEEMGSHQGLGIGLYLCMQIVTGHQGKIWVESETGKGSTFYVKLPLTKKLAKK